jgi:dihydrofolate reductase
MASYWPTAMAQENDPEIATKMNTAQKWVCSNSLSETHWENTEIISGDIFQRIQELKNTSNRNLTLLGSNNLITQLAERGLIDELQLMIDPVSIEDGVPLFSGMKHPISFAPKQVRALNSGVVLIRYQYQH